MAARSQKNPGRPRADDRTSREVRERLLTTAARLFAAHGYDGTSLRAVADGAEVTPAMVAYYFRDKAGLLEAVVLDGLDHVLDAARRAAEESGEGAFVPRLIREYLGVIQAHPWIPGLMMREVISRDTPLRKLVQERFMARAVEIVPPRVAADVAAQRLRSDLDPRLAVLSMIGMCVFPYLAEPVLGPLLGYRVDDEFGASYSDHTVRLFLEGAGADSP